MAIIITLKQLPMRMSSHHENPFNSRHSNYDALIASIIDVVSRNYSTAEFAI